jgi:serine/threonine protein kinase
MSTASPYDAIEDLLVRAMAIEDRQIRRRWAEELLQGQPEKLAELLSLTEAADRPAWFDRPLKPLVQAIGESQSRMGSRIGPYQLIEQIGAGGMGHVYLARQSSPVRRMVALKLLQRNPTDAHAFERFRREQQVLASLEHPNIAHIFDAGSADSGDAFLAMEYIQGSQLIDHCRAQRLGIHQRVALMIQCCKAIQHAHQKGIIHRDIKPSNVLVTTVDGDPVVKVIDFGIAKAFQSDWGDSWRSGDEGGQGQSQSVLTQAGSTPGTPPFMSPEQYSQEGDRIDTRSDVYALGALLYNLLAGVPPFDTQIQQTQSLADLRDLVQHNDPMPPSERFPDSAKALRGDLDAIVAKAMQRDPERRYQTVQQLAEDLRNYLANAPVSAHPETTFEHLCRVAKRNRLSLGAVILATSGLLAGLFIAIAQRQLAVRSERKSKQEAFAFELLLASMAAQDGNFSIARQLLDRYSEASVSSPKSTARSMPLDWRLLRSQLPSEPVTIANFPTKLYFGLSLPSRQEIATAGKDSHLRIVHEVSGQLRLDIDTEQGEINGLALHPDGTQIASGGDDGTVKVWDVTTGALVRSWKASDKQVYQLDWSNDGQFFVTAGSAPDVSIWNASDFQLSHRLDSQGEALECLGVSRQGRAVYGSTNGLVRVADIDPQSEGNIQPLALSPSRATNVNRCSSVAFSPSSQWLAVGLDHGNLVLLKQIDGRYQPIERIRFLSTVSAVAFDTTETRLAIGESNGNAHMLQLPDRTPTRSRLLFTDFFVGEQKRFAPRSSGSIAPHLSIDALWRLVVQTEPTDPREDLPLQCDRVYLEFREPLANLLCVENYLREWFDDSGMPNPDWNEVPEQVTYKGDGVELHFSNRWSGWSNSQELIDSGRLMSWSGHAKRVASICWGSNGQVLHSVSEDGSINRIRIAVGAIERIPGSDFYDLAPMDEGKVMLLKTSGHIQLVEAENSRANSTISLGPYDGTTSPLPLSAGSPYLLAKQMTSAADRAILRANIRTGEILQTDLIPPELKIYSVVAAIDEDRFIVQFQADGDKGKSSPPYGCWSLRDQTVLWRLSSRSELLRNLIVSPSKTYLVFSDDRYVELVDPQTGFKRTLGHFPEIDLNSLRFSHDERYLLVVCEDHRIVCYRTDDGSHAWTLPMTGSPAHDAAWSKDQRTILCVTRDGSIKTYDIALQQLTAEIPLPTRDLIRVLLSADERSIYVLDRTGQVLCVRCNPLPE